MVVADLQMTTGVRRGNDNEGALVDVEPQEGVGVRVIGLEVLAVEVVQRQEVECQEVDARQEAHDQEVESGVHVGPRVQRTGIRWRRLGLGASLRVQRDRQPRR